MHPDSDPYDGVVGIYIRLIKQQNRDAGFAIEQIHVASGARAALRATLVITLLKMTVKDNYRIDDLSIYNEFARAYPEALPLRHAVACCCLTWGIVDPTVRYSLPDTLLNADTFREPETYHPGRD